jgi:hypothetical protein
MTQDNVQVSGLPTPELAQLSQYVVGFSFLNGMCSTPF